MLRRIIFGMGMGMLVIMLGCPSSYPNCKADDECAEKGEVCVQGTCQECATDTNCKLGFVCSANKCIPKPDCRSHMECGVGELCVDNKCVTDPYAQNPGACTHSGECPSGQECQDGFCATAQAACTLPTVYFGFDESQLSFAAQSELSSLANCLKQTPMSLNVEGHADERGTEEYNLQLSNRRAASVKRYLSTLGVKADRLNTIGYGKNRPAARGSNEEAWAANRRVEFVSR
ncbi:MAG: OmpA family protein [Cystobacterineae bacterium]|nr:OmpA family protein [Cystobacterineae bacterium]MCL2258387.1 OmpA family protein [Cystobacterineae bacterium]